MDDDDAMLKVSEVAKAINMTPEYVRRRLIEPAGGTLPACKVGKHWRVKKSDLKEYLENRYKISGTRPVNV
jgi:excisionase family DNA binding protein